MGRSISEGIWQKLEDLGEARYLIYRRQWTLDLEFCPKITVLQYLLALLSFPVQVFIVLKEKM